MKTYWEGGGIAPSESISSLFYVGVKLVLSH